MFTNSRTYLRWMAFGLALCVPLEHPVRGQSTGAANKVLTLEEAVDFPLKNYPAVRASLERVNAAQAGIGLARTNYLPRADMIWQTNRATDNNIAGLVLPQSIIAAISGPVPATTSVAGQLQHRAMAGAPREGHPVCAHERGHERPTENFRRARTQRESRMGGCGYRSEHKRQYRDFWRPAAGR